MTLCACMESGLAQFVLLLFMESEITNVNCNEKYK